MPIQSLIKDIETSRDRWTAARDAGQTQYCLNAIQDEIRDGLRRLDNVVWSRRRAGETVAQVRARLAPSVDW